MATAMTPQGNRLFEYLQNPGSDSFFADLVPLLEEFTASVTGTSNLFEAKSSKTTTLSKPSH
jgi:hypothetical protein